MRRYVFFPALVAAFAVFVVAAGAAWLANGTGGSFSRSTNLGQPTSVAATATGTSTVQVTWQPPAVPSPPPASYDVFRYFGQTGTKICSATTGLVCNDTTGLSPNTTYGYTVEARLGSNWLSGQTTQVNATTQSATANFKVEQVVAGNATAGTPFQLRLTAQTGTTTDATYTGAHTLSFSGPGANGGFTGPSYPTGPVSFTNGVATVSVTLRKAETTSLTVSEATPARSGSTPVTVVAGSFAAVRYTSSKVGPNSGNATAAVCSPGGELAIGSRTFFSKVTRLDASGNPVSGAQASVGFQRNPSSGSIPGTTTIQVNESESNEFSYSLANGSNAVAVTLTATVGSASVSCTLKP